MLNLYFICIMVMFFIKNREGDPNFRTSWWRWRKNAVAKHHWWPTLLSHKFAGDFSPEGSFLIGLKVAGMDFMVYILGWKHSWFWAFPGRVVRIRVGPFLFKLFVRQTFFFPTFLLALIFFTCRNSSTPLTFPFSVFLFPVLQICYSASSYLFSLPTL